jgi:hypothetical protein
MDGPLRKSSTPCLRIKGSVAPLPAEAREPGAHCFIRQRFTPFPAGAEQRPVRKARQRRPRTRGEAFHGRNLRRAAGRPRAAAAIKVRGYSTRHEDDYGGSGQGRLHLRLAAQEVL